MNFSDVLSLSRLELAGLLEDGYSIEPTSIEEGRYLGVSLGLPRWLEWLTWKTFEKDFHRDRNTGALRGWNVRLQQTGLDGMPVPRMRGDSPKTFGHFQVKPIGQYRVPRACPQGLMLDYNQGGTHLLNPLQALRDPLVALRPGNSDLLLGWSYLDLGFWRMSTRSFFVLKRIGDVEFIPKTS